MRRRGATNPIVRPAQRGAPLLRQHDAEVRAMRAKIHIAKKDLRLDDDDYRAILLRVTGFTSSADCGPSHLEELLKEFRRLGWKAKAGKGARKPPSPRAQIRMIYAVFNDLKPHLAVGDESTLRAFVQRQTKTAANPAGISAPEFLDAAAANKVLEGLKAWRARVRARAAEQRDDQR